MTTKLNTFGDPQHQIRNSYVAKRLRSEIIFVDASVKAPAELWSFRVGTLELATQKRGNLRPLRIARAKRTLNTIKLCSWERRHLNGLLIVAILLISTAPLYAQRQQQNVAKLKADARNLVGIIGSDKTKIQTYCQIDDLSEQIMQAVQEKDRKKANALAEKIPELYKEMGPEFAALIDIEKHVNLNSRDGQEIASIVASLGESCPH